MKPKWLLIWVLIAQCICGEAFAAAPRKVDEVIAWLRQAQVGEDELRLAREVIARPVPAEVGPEVQSRALLDRARANDVLGFKDVQLADLRRAAVILKDAGQPLGYGLTVDLSTAEALNGNFMTAVRLREEALKNAQKPSEKLSHLSNLTDFYGMMGDVASAERTLREAEGIFEQLGMASRKRGFKMDLYVAQIERARGAYALLGGNMALAESHYLQAAKGWEAKLAESDDGEVSERRLARRSGVAAMAATYRRAAKAISRQGRLVDAEVLLRETLGKVVRFAGGRSTITLGVVNDLANSAIEQGRAREAAKLANYTISSLEAAGVTANSSFLIHARQNLAASYVVQGKWQEALNAFEESRRNVGDIELQSQLASGTRAWVQALLRAGRTAEAVDMAKALVARAERYASPSDPVVAEARGYLANALNEHGDWEASLREYRVAVPILLDRASNAIEPGENPWARVRRQNNVFEGYLALLFDMHRKGIGIDGLDIVGEAFRIADVARGSVVQQAMTAQTARMAIRDPKLEELARQEQDMGRRLSALQELVGRLASVPPEEQLPGILQKARDDIANLRKGRNELRQRIANAFPEYAELLSPRPVGLSEVRAMLEPDEALLSIYVGRNETYVWVVKANGDPSFAATGLNPKDLAQTVKAIRKSVDVSAGGGEGKFEIGKAHELYRRLFGPVEASLDASVRSLIVTPHRSLGELPFSLLVTAPIQLRPGSQPFAEYAEVPWLIKRWAISQLPSAATLVALRKFERTGGGARQAFAGFGDPLFKPGQSEAGANSLNMRMAKRGLHVRSAPLRSADSEGASLDQLQPLPDTAVEIREIAGLLKAGNNDVYLGALASEGRVKAGALNNRRVVVFATHGLVPGDLVGLTQPALALSSPEVTREQDSDGLLSMDEILGLRLNADWVVLSACNTASGEGAGSEAVSGLGRAFFYAGVRSLLVTAWPVETVSARQLTTSLFAQYSAGAQVDRSEALRQAMLKVMQSGAMNAKTGRMDYSYAHPMFWAPFVLVGEGRH